MEAWTQRRETADGVPAEAGGPSPEPQDLLAMRDFGGPARASGRDFESDPLVAVLGTPGDTFRDQLVAGQALQRVLLTATEHRLAVSLLSQPIEVPAARERLRRGLGRLGAPQMVLRIGYGQPGFPTPRRPVSEVVALPKQSLLALRELRFLRLQAFCQRGEVFIGGPSGAIRNRSGCRQSSTRTWR